MKLFLFFLILFPTCIFSQDIDSLNIDVEKKDSITNKEFAFVNHLIYSKFYDEALIEINTNSVLLNNLDSANYLKGWTLYMIKDLDNSTLSLLKVSRNHPTYIKSRFFASYNQVFIGKYSFADSLLSSINFGNNENRPLQSLYNFEKAGICLLNQNFENFNKYYSIVDTAYYFLENEAKRMPLLAMKIQGNKRKSRILAGAMSTIIPGLGKIYAGKTKEGIASFMHVGVLGLITYDLYRKDKKINVFNTLSAVVFAVFYGGNIYGSVSCVDRVYNERKHEIENQILFDMHIPLRVFFN